MQRRDRHVIVVGIVNGGGLPSEAAAVESAVPPPPTSDLRRAEGKAANIAISASAHGPPTFLVGATSGQHRGIQELAELERLGVNVDEVTPLEDLDEGLGAESSKGNGPRRGAQLDPSQVRSAVQRRAGARGGSLILSAEVPDNVAVEAARSATAAGLTTIYDATPPRPPHPDVVAHRLIVIANRAGATQLSGESDPLSAARWLREQFGVGVVTLGRDGAIASSVDGLVEYAANVVEVVDDTGAGAAFCGALAAVLATTQNLAAAAAAGVEAGGRAVSHRGPRSWVYASGAGEG